MTLIPHSPAGFGGDDDDDDDDDDDSVEAVSVKDDGAQRFNHHSSDAAVAHKDSRDDGAFFPFST
jgi:hypothetical protein